MEIRSLDGPSIFLEILGDSPRNKIIDFLVGSIGMDYTLKEIAQGAGVGYATIKRIWPNFIKYNLVKSTRKVGKAVFYTYNTKSHIGKLLNNFHVEVIYSNIEKEAIPKIKTKI